jgi:hypothetical protein
MKQTNADIAGSNAMRCAKIQARAKTLDVWTTSVGALGNKSEAELDVDTQSIRTLAPEESDP